MRAAAGCAFFLLAACSQSEGPPVANAAAEKIACALNGARDFSDTCFVERVTVDGGKAVVIRHPDGGFRRLDIGADGSFSQSDGSQQAVVVKDGPSVEIMLGADRYRLDQPQVVHAR